VNDVREKSQTQTQMPTQTPPQNQMSKPNLPTQAPIQNQMPIQNQIPMSIPNQNQNQNPVEINNILSFSQLASNNMGALQRRDSVAASSILPHLQSASTPISSTSIEDLFERAKTRKQSPLTSPTLSSSRSSQNLSPTQNQNSNQNPNQNEWKGGSNGSSQNLFHSENDIDYFPKIQSQLPPQQSSQPQSRSQSPPQAFEIRPSVFNSDAIKFFDEKPIQDSLSKSSSGLLLTPKDVKKQTKQKSPKPILTKLQFQTKMIELLQKNPDFLETMYQQYLQEANKS